MPNAKPKPKTPAAPKKQPRQNRPRVDAVIRHIEQGSYDDHIGDLLAAIETRRAARQEAVLAQVKQVYGEDYTVVPEGQPYSSTGKARPNPFIEPKPLAPEDQKEWEEAERRARAQEEALKQEDFGADDVSNSPLIGSIDVSAPPETQP